MVQVAELRNLFILLIRQFRPGVQSKQYLEDLITTNHVLLLLLEQNEGATEELESFHVSDFIKDFSSPVIIQQYGILLEDFQRNGEYVNDCVFTMMHHVAGDLAKPEALCQPHILKIFSQIWEIEFEIKDVSGAISELLRFNYYFLVARKMHNVLLYSLLVRTSLG